MAAETPRIWLVLGDKGGDNAQVETLAAALPWPVERRSVAMKPKYIKGKPWVQPSLHHLDLSKSDPLEPPWPHLVITIGRRPSMVALWIQQQSGGATRIVSVGKPSTSVNRFDLVIASSEVVLPKFPHVLSVDMPLMQVDAARAAAAAARWREFDELPRPLVAILIGGPTNPYVFDNRLADRVVELAREIVSQGGTPYLSTSRRTPGEFISRIAESLPSQARFFRWSAAASLNPYQALLGGADAFIVSADSISMQVEVARLGKPLAILPVPSTTWGRIDRYRRDAVSWVLTRKPALGRLLYTLKLVNQTRDYAAFHERLIAEGRAVWAGDAFVAPPGPAEPDVTEAVEQIKALAAVGAVS